MKKRLMDLFKKIKYQPLPHSLEATLATQFSEFALNQIVDEMLANGVIALPCKVGDAIYQTDGIKIYESTVMEITYTTNKVVYCTENICFDETAIDKSIFLNREEAEKHLKG